MSYTPEQRSALLERINALVAAGTHSWHAACHECGINPVTPRKWAGLEPGPPRVHVLPVLERTSDREHGLRREMWQRLYPHSPGWAICWHGYE